MCLIFLFLTNLNIYLDFKLCQISYQLQQHQTLRVFNLVFFHNKTTVSHRNLRVTCYRQMPALGKGLPSAQCQSKIIDSPWLLQFPSTPLLQPPIASVCPSQERFGLLLLKFNDKGFFIPLISSEKLPHLNSYSHLISFSVCQFGLCDLERCVCWLLIRSLRCRRRLTCPTHLFISGRHSTLKQTVSSCHMEDTSITPAVPTSGSTVLNQNLLALSCLICSEKILYEVPTGFVFFLSHTVE